MSTSFAESVAPVAQPTFTEELQDHLNNIELTKDRIAKLIDELGVRITGAECGTVGLNDRLSYGKSVSELNNHARDTSVALNELGDKLAYLVNSL